MEFKFAVNEILKQPIVEIGHTLTPPGFTGDRRAYWDVISKVSEVVNAMGEASAAAQGLTKPITTAERLRNSEHKIFLLVDQSAGHGRGAVTGMLKTGKKGLYVFDRNGQHYQVSPPCVLDFYVHESRQRTGLGKRLFDHMLQHENIEPVKMAIDRPSDKFQGFLNKHYRLNNPIKQMNNYVVFDGFFPDARQEKNGAVDDITSPSAGALGKKQSANGLQTMHYPPRLGRYGATKPACSMGQIIHNQTSTIPTSAEPTGTQSMPVLGSNFYPNPMYNPMIPPYMTQSTPNMYYPPQFPMPLPPQYQFPYDPKYYQQHDSASVWQSLGKPGDQLPYNSVPSPAQSQVFFNKQMFNPDSYYGSLQGSQPNVNVNQVPSVHPVATGGPQPQPQTLGQGDQTQQMQQQQQIQQNYAMAQQNYQQPQQGVMYQLGQADVSAAQVTPQEAQGGVAEAAQTEVQQIQEEVLQQQQVHAAQMQQQQAQQQAQAAQVQQQQRQVAQMQQQPESQAQAQSSMTQQQQQMQNQQQQHAQQMHEQQQAQQQQQLQLQQQQMQQEQQKMQQQQQATNLQQMQAGDGTIQNTPQSQQMLGVVPNMPVPQQVYAQPQNLTTPQMYTQMPPNYEALQPAAAVPSANMMGSRPTSAQINIPRYSTPQTQITASTPTMQQNINMPQANNSVPGFQTPQQVQSQNNYPPQYYASQQHQAVAAPAVSQAVISPEVMHSMPQIQGDHNRSANGAQVSYSTPQVAPPTPDVYYNAPTASATPVESRTAVPAAKIPQHVARPSGKHQSQSSAQYNILTNQPLNTAAAVDATGDMKASAVPMTEEELIQRYGYPPQTPDVYKQRQLRSNVLSVKTR